MPPQRTVVGHALQAGKVPKSALDEAEVRGWAPVVECVDVPGARVVYEIREHSQTKERTHTPIAVLAERYTGDAAVVGAFLKVMEERQADVAERGVVPVIDLVIVDDIAKRVRLKNSTVQKWIQRYEGDFPAPLVKWSGWIHLYDWQAVLAWVEKKFPAYAARVPNKWRVVA